MLTQTRSWVAFIPIFLLLVMAGVTTRPSLAQESDAAADAARAVTWLVTTHQNEDGGYASFSGGAGTAASDVNGTLDALLAIASTGRVPLRTVTYLEENAAALTDYAAVGGGEAGKVILALTAIERDPRAFAGTDFVALLQGQLDDSGQWAGTAYNQALAILGTVAAGETAPDAAVQWLIDQQATDGDVSGSWDDGFGTTGNVDATAMATMALLAAGRDPADDATAAALDFLESARRESGGWAYGADVAPSANSTALALQALAAAGRSADAPSTLTPFLGDTGAFQVDFGDGPADDFFATVQVLPALLNQPYPLVTQAEPADEPADEPVDEPVDEPADEPADEPTSEPVDEPEVEVTPAIESDSPATEGGETRFWLALGGFAVIAVVVAVVGLRMGRP